MTAKKDNNDVYEDVKVIFTEHLRLKKYRKTQGRYDILKEIYSMDEHFEVELLYLNLKGKNYHISRATIYNTIDLLLECGLIVKHSFGNKAGSYEKSFGNRQHDHIINLKTQEVIEFRDPRIQDIVTSLAAQYNFEVSHYSFTLYGTPKQKN